MCVKKSLNLSVKLLFLFFTNLFVYLFVYSLLVLFFCIKNASSLTFDRLIGLLSGLLSQFAISVFSLTQLSIFVTLDFIFLKRSYHVYAIVL